MREISVVVHANNKFDACVEAERRMAGEKWFNIVARNPQPIDDERWRVDVIGEVTEEMLLDKETGPGRTTPYPITGGLAR